jgi:hypothetical protein
MEKLSQIDLRLRTIMGESPMGKQKFKPFVLEGMFIISAKPVSQYPPDMN